MRPRSMGRATKATTGESRVDMVGSPALVVAPLFSVVGMFGKRDSKSRFCKEVTTIRDADAEAGKEQGKRNKRKFKWPCRSQADDVVQSAQPRLCM